MICSLRPWSTSAPDWTNPRHAHRARRDRAALARAAQATDPEGAAFLLREAIEQARAHFAKEEQVAFPLAEHVLEDTRLHELGALWAERRAVSVPA
jgi:hypothetical protein